MSVPDYGPPVDQLLRISDDLRKEKEWPDYLGMGLTLDDIPELIRMAVDRRWDEIDSDRPEVWASVHAWRALGTLRAEAAVPALVGLLRAQEDDDFDEWIGEVLPEVLGMIGPPAIPDLTALLGDKSAELNVRVAASRSLAQVAEEHPEAREVVVSTLIRILERGADNDPTLNGFIISDLADLNAKEAAGAIERAYADDGVDDSIMGTWHDVWPKFGLEGDPPPKTQRRYTLFGDRITNSTPVAPSSGVRRPADRKARNKAKRKLEKKAKKKQRKR